MTGPEGIEPVDAERWRAVERVLDRALDADPAEWPAIVRDACGDDTALRREVETLLAEYGRHETVLDTAAGSAGKVAAALLEDMELNGERDALLGTQLGPWRVVQPIGHGGMARVFLGERADGAYTQRVAIKVLRAGLDTRADVERFRRERRILAGLEHPNIARLLDGGVAPDGRPYLVLEYVEGEALTTWSNSRALDVAGRLRIFLAVVEAIDAAHRQLVVHRDLKPSNILVSADGRPRLLDFGIATIVDPAHEDGSDALTTRRRWLTPDYAAPEQFTGGAVTTATDVWQLGVVLYELLAGRRPFADDAGTAPAEHDGARGRVEARVLAGDAPPAPSRFRQELRGDLDAVVLRALRHEPSARYPSVADLAADVRRVLAGDPVDARAGDTSYRWRRWVRRRAVPLTAGAVAILALAGYATTLALQNRRIARALAAAEVERQKAEQVTDFLFGLFRANDPRALLGDTITARALLERGESHADSLASQPEVQATMFELIGQVRHDLGAYPPARAALERALAIRRRVLGDSHPDVARSVAALGVLAESEGRFRDAERAHRDALALQRASLGDTAAATQRSRFGLANALHVVERVPEARDAFDDWKRADSARAPGRDAEAAAEYARRGQLVKVRARMRNAPPTDSAYAEAAQLFGESLAIRRALHGDRHADVAQAQELLADVLELQGRFDESETLYTAAAATLRAVYPGGHPNLATLLVSHAHSQQRRGAFATALPLMREGVAMARQHLAADDPSLTSALAMYGATLHRSGDPSGAEPLLREAVDRFARQVGPRHLLTVQARARLGNVLGVLGRTSEAESLMVASYADLAQSYPTTNARVQGVLQLLVPFYERSGRTADAARYRALLLPADSAARGAGIPKP